MSSELWKWLFSAVVRTAFSGVYVKKAHLILRGHRSIVNQVRYSHHSGIIISSGVEKIIKVMQQFALLGIKDS